MNVATSKEKSFSPIYINWDINMYKIIVVGNLSIYS
jgi:hypothetical protein